MKQVLFLFLIFTLSATAYSAQSSTGTSVIRRNSFLLEEGFTLPERTAQHLVGWRYDRHKNYTAFLEQEWGIADDHLFWYDMPIYHTSDPTRTGPGDLRLNYNYQATNKTGVAFAPRFTLVLPTGNYKYGFGRSTVGYQVNFPLSVSLSKLFMMHWNLGVTWTPKGKGLEGSNATTLDTNYGASLVYLLTNRANFLFEVAGTGREVVLAQEVKGRAETLFLAPGFRYTFDCHGLRLTPGGSMQVGIGPSEREYAGYLQFSIEHKY